LSARVLAVCKLPDGSEVNAWLVRQGWALATGFVKMYESEQDEAEAAKRGIWAGAFTPPWKWRQEHPRRDGSPKREARHSQPCVQQACDTCAPLGPDAKCISLVG
jgi:hypothetical protein